MTTIQALEYCGLFYLLTLAITLAAVNVENSDKRIYQFIIAFVPVALTVLLFLILI